MSADTCLICLSVFDQQTVASLQDCQHVFCLDCVLQWSQTSNTCPVDRTSFSFIYQRRCPGGEIQKKIKVMAQPRRKKEDEGEDEDAVICEECGRGDRRLQLLVCAHCDSGYHMNCLTPSLITGPDSDWICPDCAVTPPLADDSMMMMMEEEISDGELTDLLGEVDGTESTSSRLRPSTMDRPRGSTHPRHSARLQNRIGIDRHRRPQTSLRVPKHLLRASRPCSRSR